MTQIADDNIPDRAGRLLIVFLSMVASLLLLVAHRGLDSHSGFFSHSTTLTVWYTLTIAVPLVVSLLVRTARDAYPAAVAAGLCGILSLVAWHTGDAVEPANPHDSFAAGTIYGPYCVSVAIALFVLTPFLQSARDVPARFTYGALYRYSWDNGLALAAAGVFTLVGWLILWLWGALFDVIKVPFFKILFEDPNFVYPVSGLFVGFGLVLGRAQIGAVRSVLTVCFALSRALLPLIATLAVVFLAGLAFNNIEPLWKTGHASALLLGLILGTVVLLNAVYQDGTNARPYGAVPRVLVNAALLTLPIFVGIALYAIDLRVQQHGLSVARLWGIVVATFSTLYALSYAAAVAIRRERWLALISPANTGIALALVLVLLLSQSPLLDFRAISLHNQLARLEAGGFDLSKFDLKYLRFHLGRQGQEALLELKQNPRVPASQLAMIDDVLAKKYEYEPTRAQLDLSKLRIVPANADVPHGLLEAIQSADQQQLGYYVNPDQCSRTPSDCVLASVNLSRDGTPTWLFFAGPYTGIGVFTEGKDGWGYRGSLDFDGCARQELAAALEAGTFRMEEPAWNDLIVGNHVLRFRPRRECGH